MTGELVCVMGKEMTMDEARNLWFALSKVFGPGDPKTYWNLIPDENQGKTMGLFCPCPGCTLMGVA